MPNAPTAHDTNPRGFAYSREQFQQLAEDALTLARTLGASEAAAEVSEGVGLSVSVRKGEIENVERNRDKSLGVTVYVGKRRGNASTSDFSRTALEQTVRAAHDIARFTADGLLDSTFTTNNGGANNNYIEAMAIQPNGRIVIGGSFTRYNSPSADNRNRIARILSNGDLDESFNPGAGADGTVWSLLHLPNNGKAVIGGQFTTYNGITRNQLAQVFASPGNYSAGPDMLLLDD